MNRLVPTEKYLRDCSKWVGAEEESPAFKAHRRLLLELASGGLQLPSGGGNPGSRLFRREPIDDQHDLVVSAIAVRLNDGGFRVELRGLKKVPSGGFLL